MPKYHVPVRRQHTTVYEVEAPSAEQAMHLATDADDGDEFDSVKIVNEIDGDAEAYYPDIIEVADK